MYTAETFSLCKKKKNTPKWHWKKEKKRKKYLQQLAIPFCLACMSKSISAIWKCNCMDICKKFNGYGLHDSTEMTNLIEQISKEYVKN